MNETKDLSRREAIALLAGVTAAGFLAAETNAHAEENQAPQAKVDYDVVIVGGGPECLPGPGPVLPQGAGVRRGEAAEPHLRGRSRVLLARRNQPRRAAQDRAGAARTLRRGLARWTGRRGREGGDRVQGHAGKGQGCRRAEARTRHRCHRQVSRRPWHPGLVGDRGAALPVLPRVGGAGRAVGVHRPRRAGGRVGDVALGLEQVPHLPHQRRTAADRRPVEVVSRTTALPCGRRRSPGWTARKGN